MIIDPDFLDHWKTRLLVDALGGDEMAPLYLLRIWAHCQNRRKTQFKPMPNPGLKALCRYTGDAAHLADALENSGFIARSAGDVVDVLGWSDKNAQLVAAWANGKKGGRPRNNPTKTRGIPMGNPMKTLGKPYPSSASLKCAHSDATDHFETFWNAVHYKTGKAAARKAYSKAVALLKTDSARTQDPHEFLCERMAAFAQTPRANATDHTPIHPATWLNQGCYDDDPATWNGGSSEATRRVNGTQATIQRILDKRHGGHEENPFG